MSYKIVFPILVGVVGTSVAAATTISTGVFSSPKKCWYDGEKDGSFLEKVDKLLKENHGDKDNTEVKNLIKTLCTTPPGISLFDFEDKFGDRDYKDVFKLLIEKRSSIKRPQN